MHYVSTRGGTDRLSFSDVLLEGLARDGGLFVPQSYPRLPLHEMKRYAFAGVVRKVMSAFAPEIPEVDLHRMIATAYTKEKFPGSEMAPVEWLNPELGLLRLSEGPTRSFKDMALQLVGQLMDRELKARSEHSTVLLATSGDTGSAAAHALRGMENASLFILIPEGKMSEFQRRQMTTIPDRNVHVISVRTVFDGCQALVKEVNLDAKFKTEYRIGAMNSINWARIAAQTAYWVWAGIQTMNAGHGRMTFAVPSGNFGNALSAFIARQMGVPADVLVCTNDNYVLDMFFRDGIYKPWPREDVVDTSSPSMNIAEASNLERLIFLLKKNDPEKVCNIMHALKGGQDWRVAPGRLRKIGLRSMKTNEAEVRAAMCDSLERHRRMIDPHTAVAYSAVMRSPALRAPVIIAETAKPVKFAETVQAYTGATPVLQSKDREMMTAPERFTTADPDAEAIKRIIREYVQAAAA